MSEERCVEDGCSHGWRTGDVLYRVSPMGRPFRGKCADHARAIIIVDGVITTVEALRDRYPARP